MTSLSRCKQQDFLSLMSAGGAERPLSISYPWCTQKTLCRQVFSSAMHTASSWPLSQTPSGLAASMASAGCQPRSSSCFQNLWTGQRYRLLPQRQQHWMRAAAPAVQQGTAASIPMPLLQQQQALWMATHSTRYAADGMCALAGKTHIRQDGHPAQQARVPGMQ